MKSIERLVTALEARRRNWMQIMNSEARSGHFDKANEAQIRMFELDEVLRIVQMDSNE